MPLEEYDAEMEVYINFANIGYIKKEYQEDPHMAVYIELFKKHFKITYINKDIIYILPLLVNQRFTGFFYT